MTKRPERILITGTGRGLGLQFTRHWLAGGREVFALARDPKGSEALQTLQAEHGQRLHTARCDVAGDGSVAEARSEVGKIWDSLDLLVNNAGTYGPKRGSLETVKLDDVRRVFEVNTLGSIRVNRAFVPLLRGGVNPRVVHLTSLMGSIGDNTSGGSWSYRISKTALNMVCRNLAHELREEGIPCVVIHPGWVRTDMGGSGAPLTVKESVAAMAATIDRLGIARTGAFLDKDGHPLPW
jgi:NAD(P)-dependent dehydrogenase (short-subunit alcohol dehydrogenase family)